MRKLLLILAFLLVGTPTFAQTQIGGGGSSVSPNTSTVPGIYAGASPYNAKFDGRTSQDGVTNGTTTVTSATLSCVNADVGKTIFTVNTATSLAKASSTVASCSGANFIMNAAATASESGVNLVVCSDDTTALQNSWNAALAANLPLFLPIGLTCVSSRPFLIPGAPIPISQPPFLIGAGQALTIIGMVPSFSFAGVAAGTIFDNGQVSGTCNWQTSAVKTFPEATVQDLAVTGFGFNFPSWPASMPVFGRLCQGHRLGIYIINASASSFIGISAPQESFIDDANIQGNGNGIGILMTGGGSTAIGNIIAFGTTGGIGYSILNAGNGVDIIGGFTTSLTTGIKVVNSLVNVVDLQISTGSSTTGMTIDATSTVNAARVTLVQTGVSTSVGFNVATGGKLKLNQLNYQPSGTPTEIINAGTVFDAGGNDLGGTITNTGSWFGSSSITGTAQTGGNIVPSACGTSTVGTISGSGGNGQFTLTFAGAPGATCTVTVTFPNAFPPSTVPLCSFLDVGGTNAFPTSIINGTVNATTAAFTETATAFTNGNTEVIQYSCRLP